MTDNLKQKKLFLAVGIYPPTVGGVSYYAKSLVEAFDKINVLVTVRYFTIENILPSILRHIFYLVKVWWPIYKSDGVIALDTFSTGVPACLVANFLKKKIVVRVGGDFLWESFVDRTKENLILRDFYKKLPELTIKEIIILKITKWLVKKVDVVVFSTRWQADIWIKFYNIDASKVLIIENNLFIKKPVNVTKKFNEEEVIFLWAGRNIFLKNINKLKEAFSIAKQKNKNIKLKLLDNVRQEALFSEINNSDIVIIPSLTDISPNLALEALSLGKMVILTKENGLKDRLKDNILYINPLDTSDIVEKMLFLSHKDNYLNLKNKVDDFIFERNYHDIAIEFNNIFYESL